MTITAHLGYTGLTTHGYQLYMDNVAVGSRVQGVAGGITEIGDGEYRADAADGTFDAVVWDTGPEISPVEYASESFVLSSGGSGGASAADVAAAVWTRSERTLSATQAFNNTGQTTSTPATVDKTGYLLANTQSFNNTGQTNELPATDATLRSRLTAARALILDSVSTHTVLDIWNASVNAAFSPNTLGKKLKDWVLGTDNKALISTDVHASGVTVANMTDKTGITLAQSAIDAVQSGLATIANQTALSTAVAAIQNNTSTRLVVPKVMELPPSGTVSFEIDLLIYDSNGNMEALDSTPTITVANQAGTNRSASLSALTNPSAGFYKATFTRSSTDPSEQLTFTATVVEGGVSRIIMETTQVADQDVSAIATQLAAIYADYARRTDIPADYATDTALAAAKTVVDAIRATDVPNLTTAINNPKTLTAAEHTAIVTDAQTALTNQGYTTTRAGYLDVLNGLVTAIWDATTRTLSTFGFTVNTNANSTETAIATNATAIKAKTDNLPASPAAVGSAMTLATGERDTLAALIESRLLNEGDGQMLINAIVGAIGNTNIDQTVLVAAIRADLERNGGNLATLLSRITASVALESSVSALAASVGTPQQAGSAVTLPAGVATSANVTAAQTAIITAVDNKPVTAATDVSALATTTQLTAARDVITAAIENIEVTGGGGSGGLTEEQGIVLSRIDVNTISTRQRLAEQVPDEDTPVVVLPAAVDVSKRLVRVDLNQWATGSDSVAGLTVKCKLILPTGVVEVGSGFVVSGAAISKVTNTEGIADFEIVPTDAMTPAGAKYSFFVVTDLGGFKLREVAVPSGSSVNLADLS